jgi:hypothetical protein
MTEIWTEAVRRRRGRLSAPTTSVPPATKPARTSKKSKLTPQAEEARLARQRLEANGVNGCRVTGRAISSKRAAWFARRRGKNIPTTIDAQADRRRIRAINSLGKRLDAAGVTDEAIRHWAVQHLEHLEARSVESTGHPAWLITDAVVSAIEWARLGQNERDAEVRHQAMQPPYGRYAVLTPPDLPPTVGPHPVALQCFCGAPRTLDIRSRTCGKLECRKRKDGIEYGRRATDIFGF